MNWHVFVDCRSNMESVFKGLKGCDPIFGSTQLNSIKLSKYLDSKKRANPILRGFLTPKVSQMNE